MPPEGYITTNQYARRHRMSWMQVYRAVHSCELPYIRKGLRIFVLASAPRPIIKKQGMTPKRRSA